MTIDLSKLREEISHERILPIEASRNFESLFYDLGKRIEHHKQNTSKVEKWREWARIFYENGSFDEAQLLTRIADELQTYLDLDNHFKKRIRELLSFN
jgi:hypothetical protein